MTKDRAHSSSSRGRGVGPLAHIGAGLVVLLLWGCGTPGAANDAESDGNSAGGASSGGAASGGASSGGASSGGASGGVGGIANACDGLVGGSGAFPLCRSQADCPVGNCQESAPSGNQCGACFPSPMECAVDTECEEGEVCVAGPEMSCQCMGPGKVCAPACTSDSCGDGEVCREDGHCVPASCVDDGYTCLEGWVCDPERAGDAHGCTPSHCDGDGFTCPDSTVCDAARIGDAHHCAPRACATEGFSCPETKVCEATAEADVHGCRFLHCTEGAECAQNYDCQAGAAGTGCVQRACSVDADCDCGACVFGRCEERLFMCVTLPG